MNLLSIGKWNDLLRELKTHNLFKTNLVNDDAKSLLAAPVLAARQILKHAPHLISKDSIRICVAGSDYADNGNKGDVYRLLPKLLNKPDLMIHIDLIGPECHKCIYPEEFRLKDSYSGKVTTAFSSVTLGEHLSSSEAPDVILMNMPGFEVHAKDWFIKDDGVARALENNIPVLCSSYANDEAELDGVYAQAYGFSVAAPEKNPLAVKRDDHGFFTWAGETWLLQRGTGRKNAELIELCDIREELLGKFIDRHADEFDIFRQPQNMALLRESLIRMGSDGQKYMWLDDDVYYLPDQHVIKDEAGNILAEDVSVETSYTHSLINELLKASFIGAVLRRDYEEEYSSGRLDFHRADLLSGLLGEEGGMDSNFFDSMRLSRPMSPMDFAQALVKCVGWNADVASAPDENVHMEATFSIVSKNVYYPVFIIGLSSMIADYHQNRDPMLIDIIETLEEEYDEFILLVGEGSHMIRKESKTNHHLVGVIHKNETTSFLFLCNEEPDAQHGRFNIKDDIALPEWSIVDENISNQYSTIVLGSLNTMLERAASGLSAGRLRNLDA